MTRRRCYWLCVAAFLILLFCRVVSKADDALSEDEKSSDAQSTVPEAASSPPINQKMAENVALALSEAGFRNYELEIRVNDGTATLLGFVRSQDDIEAATECVKKVAGVKTVVNRLEVRNDPPTPAAPETTIALRLQIELSKVVQRVVQAMFQPAPQRNLAWHEPSEANQRTAEAIGQSLKDAGFGSNSLMIEFRNGAARLTGIAADASEKDLATATVMAVQGVETVDNQLQVASETETIIPVVAKRPARIQ